MTSKVSWNFPTVFWISNAVELLERVSFYAVFIAFTLYLFNIVGFNCCNELSGIW